MRRHCNVVALAAVIAVTSMGAGAVRAMERPEPDLRSVLALHARTAALVGGVPVAIPSAAPADETLPQRQARRGLELLADQLRRQEGSAALTLPAIELALARTTGSLNDRSPAPRATSAIVFEESLDRLYAELAGAPIECCNCVTSASCSDGQFCNGAESCGAFGICATGTAPCVDGNPCTTDVCNEMTDQCSFPVIPPPAPVASLSLGRPMPPSPVANLSWSSVSGASIYNVYRGQARNLSDLGCYLSGLGVTSTFDDGAVAGGGLYVYLVSAEHCGESGLGSSSFGPRPAPAVPCP